MLCRICIFLSIMGISLVCKSNESNSKLISISGPAVKIDQKDVQIIKILEVEIFIPKDYPTPTVATSPHGNSALALVLYPNSKEPTSILRIKVSKRKSGFAVLEEIKKIQKELSALDLQLQGDPVAEFQKRPPVPQKGQFSLGIEHIQTSYWISSISRASYSLCSKQLYCNLKKVVGFF